MQLEKHHTETCYQNIFEAIKSLTLAFRLQEAFKQRVISEQCLTEKIEFNPVTGLYLAVQKFETEALENQFDNLVLSALAHLAITVDSAFDQIFGSKGALGIETISSLHNLFYLLQCAIAHEAVDTGVKYREYLDSYAITIPKEVMRKLSQDQNVAEKTIAVSSKNSNGQCLALEDFGGADGLIALATYAAELVRSRELQLQADLKNPEIILYILIESKEGAQRICWGLSQENLIIRSVILPCKNKYWWDRTNREQEFIIMAKTYEDKFELITKTIAQLQLNNISYISKITVKPNEPYSQWAYATVEMYGTPTQLLLQHNQSMQITEQIY